MRSPTALAAADTARSTRACPVCSSALALARAEGRYPEPLESLARTKTEVPVLYDLGLPSLTSENRHDLLEVLDDRHGGRSTVVTSQLPSTGPAQQSMASR